MSHRSLEFRNHAHLSLSQMNHLSAVPSRWNLPDLGNPNASPAEAAVPQVDGGKDYPVSVTQKPASRSSWREQAAKTAGVALQEMTFQEDVVDTTSSM